ncbi:MAG: class II fructose-bisphosphate aldolase [Clostridiales bacterium]|jgi:ketose-bisphosphate aldolase|nr:class II fructose-bisphosphate aldolase [Clostridiales bacterium]
MPLVTLNDVLPQGREKGYAVGAYDFMSITMMLGIMDAAEETKTPIILQFPDVPAMAELDVLAPAMLAAAKKSSVPVVVHLDHGKSFDVVKKCVAAGFSSVMIDASTEPYEENARLTKAVVDYCKPLGIPVEGELGHVGQGSEYDLGGYQYTDPDQAVDFVKATGISALAVAIGNAHGEYKGDPVINYEILKAIVDRVSIPLVLHGGSGISDADFNKIIKHGVSKINIFTELALEARARLSKIRPEGLSVFSVEAAIREGFKSRTISKIKLFGTESI